MAAELISNRAFVDVTGAMGCRLEPTNIRPLAPASVRLSNLAGSLKSPAKITATNNHKPTERSV
jgi:hypothetical protein